MIKSVDIAYPCSARSDDTSCSIPGRASLLHPLTLLPSPSQPSLSFFPNYYDISGLFSPYVGDSPRGPLKQTRESPLKTHDKPKLSAPHLNTQGGAHAAVAPTAHQDGPLKDPLEQAPPRSRAHASPRAGSASLEGAHLPRAGSARFEGVQLPRAGSASLEGAPHAHACSRTRALKALTTAGRRHHAPGARAPLPSHQLPRRKPSPPLWGTVRCGQCQSRDAAPPAPVRLTRRALEGGPAAPSICFLVTLQG
jgi:hypothetical protein